MPSCKRRINSWRRTIQFAKTFLFHSAGFFTGGSLAFRGGVKAARNNAIGCAVLLAVIEGVGIAFGKMMAGSTKLEMPQPPPNSEVQAL